MKGRGPEISVANPVNRQFLIKLIMLLKGGRGGSGARATGGSLAKEGERKESVSSAMKTCDR